ncbi:MAG: hypothetical protein JSU83_06680 [Deltaproteobacteria bacterium]|jgi:hypothetical protein|nr:MAG: hypothetical protein JSU83_06680 [Deltaproteobacteria bacterium]
MDYTEKRACARCYYEAFVTCAYFNSDRFYRAKTTNHSKHGLFFESDFSLKPGASIYIRVDNHLPEASGSGICGCGRIRSLAIAEVKWCKELEGLDGSHYGVGLKYYAPAI